MLMSCGHPSEEMILMTIITFFSCSPWLGGKGFLDMLQMVVWTVCSIQFLSDVTDSLMHWTFITAYLCCRHTIFCSEFSIVIVMISAIFTILVILSLCLTYYSLSNRQNTKRQFWRTLKRVNQTIIKNVMYKNSRTFAWTLPILTGPSRRNR